MKTLHFPANLFELNYYDKTVVRRKHDLNRVEKSACCLLMIASDAARAVGIKEYGQWKIYA